MSFIDSSPFFDAKKQRNFLDFNPEVRRLQASLKTQNVSPRKQQQAQAYLKLRSHQIHNRKTVPLEDLESAQTAEHHQPKIREFSSIDNLRLDPRDEQIILPFQSSTLEAWSAKGGSIDIASLEKQVRFWLVDLIQIVTSISFNLLKTDRLTESEMKNFAAKNLLLNTKSLFEKIEVVSLEQRYFLMRFVNEEMHQILEHIARKYPQASRRGISKRIRSRIPKIDDREDPKFDFLINQGLHLQYREDADYSQDIMNIVNSLVSFSGDIFSEDDADEASNFEVFSDFCEFIFDNVSHHTSKQTTIEAAQIVRSHIGPAKEIIPANLKHSVSLLGNEANQEARQSRKNTRSFYRQAEKNVLIGHKIPTQTPLFTDQQIEGGLFRAHHSSILRLMTKWAEQLYGTLTNPEQSIIRRNFKLKDSHGQLVHVHPMLKNLLYEAAKEQIKEVNEYRQYLRKESMYLQTLFAEEKSVGKYAHNDVSVGVMAAKLNEIGGHYMFKYINKLIHALLTIPKVAASRVTWCQREKALLQEVNLITFKIGDMMRAKCSCSESDFIKILDVFADLSKSAPDVFQTVRVKNRLEQQNNDLLINFFFANRIECELQLSVAKNIRKNEKTFYAFSHFIYELFRAQLGPITQLGAIITQYDPLASHYSTKQFFGPDLVKQCTQKVCEAKKKERAQLRQKHRVGMHLQMPFICSGCQRLAIVHNPLVLFRSDSIDCNQCRLDQLIKDFKLAQEGNKESTSTYEKTMQHIYEYNYKTPERMKFAYSHFAEWQGNIYNLVKQDKPQSEFDPAQFFPKRGVYCTGYQKLPLIHYFVSTYHKPSSTIVIGQKMPNGKVKEVLKIKGGCDHRQFMAKIKKKLRGYMLMQLKGVEKTVRDGKVYMSCSTPGCCGITQQVGTELTEQELTSNLDCYFLNDYFQTQKSTVFANNMDDGVTKMTHKIFKHQKSKRQEIIQQVKGIEVYNSNLKDILGVSIFHNLLDLNISKNPNVTSLKGVEKCIKLTGLHCTGCDLDSVTELEALSKLEFIDLAQNKRLVNLQGLQNKPKLTELSLRMTSVESLIVISECRSLKHLILKDCPMLGSLKQINSRQLDNLNVVGCQALESFDLPLLPLKSLKRLEFQKKPVDSGTFIAYELIFRELQLLHVRLKHSSSEQQEEEAYKSMVRLLNRSLSKSSSLFSEIDLEGNH